jgi:hypothetical protein
MPGAVVFIPADRSISLKNTSEDNVNLTFVFNEPSFEKMMRCASVPFGTPATPISQDEVAACYHTEMQSLRLYRQHRRGEQLISTQKRPPSIFPRLLSSSAVCFPNSFSMFTSRLSTFMG